MPREPDSGVEIPSGGAEQPLAELAQSLLAAGDVEGSVEAYTQALELAPQRADLLIALGVLRQEMNDPDAALACYRRAVEVEPENVAALQNLGYLLSNLGDPELALEHYERVLRIWPSPLSQMLAATVLPVIYDSAEDVHAWRARYSSRVRELADAGLRIDTTRSQIPTDFSLAYQGSNDREIAADFGRIYRGCDLVPASARDRRDSTDGRRLRVGFLSAFFHDHTIGRLNLGTVRNLSRAKYEVIVLSAGWSHDAMASAFEQAADSYIPLPRNVPLAREAIAEQDLDVLIFADVGMDSITSTLVYSRMAPTQCVTWGHPDTTGSPAIDYFLSGELIEANDADSHYTERLVRLPLLGVCYSRPQPPRSLRSRSFFGVSDRQHLYACPQTLYKFHPEFDAILAGILRSDPEGVLVLLEGRVRNWTDRLLRRFERTLPEAGHRVRFHPALPYDDFLSLFAVSDVVLDPLHFGGGNSSYEALAMGAPVVTLPSPFLRGRITAALYKKMHFTDLIVGSPDVYVATAVRLAADREYNRQVRHRIAETSAILFEDLNEVRGWEQFLDSLAPRRLS